MYRDLKPANVIIQGAWGSTPTRVKTAASSVDSPPRASDGRVKVLDFGLAKAFATTSDAIRNADGPWADRAIGGGADKASSVASKPLIQSVFWSAEAESAESGDAVGSPRR